jgi:hypothetical protein
LAGVALHGFLQKKEVPSFGVVKDGKCLISTDNGRFTTDKNVSDLATHTDGAYINGQHSKCFTDVLARINLLNHLRNTEDINSDPNPIVQPDTEYKVPRFVTTHGTYDGTHLHVERVLEGHGYGEQIK